MLKRDFSIVTPDYVKSLRSKLGLTQKQLSVSLGVSIQAVKKWEQGVNPIIGTSAILLFILNDDIQIYKKYVEIK